MAQTQPYRFTRLVRAPAAEAARLFTHATALRDWFCDAAQTEARPGGRFYLSWDSGHFVAGAFTALEPGRKVAFSWNGRHEPAPTQVQVSFREKSGGTQVTLTHSGVGGGAKWATMRRALVAGWTEGLENLQSVAETGLDLRAVRRPRLGILIDEFNAEIAARLGTPVKAGIRLAGTMEGSGAQAAGLQKDDVLIRFNGRKAVDFPSLGAALAGLHAGDKPLVTFYRGAARQRVALELSRFPIAEVPATGGELAAVVRQTHHAIDAGLAQVLAGVSEAQAEQRPAAHEWNLKELVAHFIATERDYQGWVADMLNDLPVFDSLEFRPNVTVRLRALVQRLGSVAALRQELTLAQAETAALLEALPAEFSQHRKHLYRRAALWVLQTTPGHFNDEHAAQFQATLAAARSA